MKTYLLALMMMTSGLAMANGANCDQAVVSLQNNVSQGVRKLNASYQIFERALKLNETELVNASRQALDNIVHDNSVMTRKEILGVGDACNRSDACAFQVSAYHNALADGVKKMDNGYEVLNAAVKFKNQELIDTANRILSATVSEVSGSLKASKLKTLDACLSNASEK